MNEVPLHFRHLFYLLGDEGYKGKIPIIFQSCLKCMYKGKKLGIFKEKFKSFCQFVSRASCSIYACVHA